MRPTSDTRGGPRIEIGHPDALSGLSTLPLQRRRGAGPIAITDEAIEPRQRERWEADLNRHYFACGCPEGAIGMIAGLVAGAVLVALLMPALGVAIGLIFGSAFIGSAAGKLAGLVRANARLKGAVAVVRREWDAPARVEEESYICG
jgi:hypothetical protein